MKNYISLWQPCKNISDEAGHFKYFKDAFKWDQDHSDHSAG